MANAAKMLETQPVRMLLMGYPGTGKTGALASLANAGYKLRILDFDGNPESLLQYTDADKLANIDIISLEDKIGMAGAVMGVKGVPTAFIRGLKALDQWKYEEADGTAVDLGASSSWGLDTIVVVDGTTGLSRAALDRALALAGQNIQMVSKPTWGLGIKEVDAFTKRLTAKVNKHHVIMISHLKIISPKEIEAKENMVNAELKERLADMVPTKLCPSVIGHGLPQTYAGDFPCTVLAENTPRGNKVVRELHFEPRVEMDLKLPVKDTAALKGLSTSDGLLKIFQALGHKGP